jgi:RNA polymerase sigma factor (sigma-70 family)
MDGSPDRMGAWMQDERLEELARVAASGDPGALDELLSLIQPQVLRRCARLLPCYQDAEEACQDVLVQVARTIERFEGRSRFTTWLHVVIANGARQTYRALKRRAAAEAPGVALPDVADPRTTSVIAGSRLDFLEALDRLEGRRPDLVAPLVLRDVCQLGYREIGMHLNIAEGTVKSRIHQARADVREYLTEGPR